MSDSATRDGHWIGQAVREYEGPLTRYVTRLMRGDVDRARDVVQEAFMRLWQADRRQIESRLGPWLYTVCRNRALDVLRKERRMTRLDDKAKAVAAPPASTGSSMAGREHVSRLLGLVEELPERQQEVLRLKFQSQLSYREIGEVMGITVSHVGVLIHEAIQAVRRKLPDRVGGPTGS